MSKLPKIDVSEIDVKKLESASITTIRTKDSSLTLKDDQEKKKRRKKRHNKPPKDTTGKIDPNRWLSKKKKKRIAATGFGTQGSSSETKQSALHHEKGQKSSQSLQDKMKGKGVQKKKR